MIRERMSFCPVGSRPLESATLSPLIVGATYSSMDDGINAARIHAQKHGFSYKITHRNKNRAVLKCSGTNCNAYARISLSKKLEEYTIGKLSDSHSCQGSLQAPRGTQREHKFLVSLLRDSMIVNKTTKVKDIQTLFKRSGVEVGYTTAHKAKESLFNESVDAQRNQFSFLRSYVEELVKVDSDTIAKLKTQEEFSSDTPDSRFHSIFVAPGSARQAFTRMRPFIAVDGTFTKNRFIQILLLSVGMDAQDQLIILAWAVVPNECYETWSWFLHCLYESYPSTNHADSVIINDREKGLLQAVHDVLPIAFNAFCCWHIASNVQSKFGLAAKRLVMPDMQKLHQI